MLIRKIPQIKSANSISELVQIKIGGLYQWIYLRGVNRDHPVLLILHGGPGTGYIGFARKFQKELEEHFVVVNWDQRGSGLSYDKNIPLESMTIQQFVADTLELTKYLCDFLKKDKIYLLGHSWGSIIGMLAILQSPKFYFRYFGVAQVANFKEAEKISYTTLLEKTKLAKNEKAYKDVVSIGPPPWADFKHDQIHQRYVEAFGGGISHDGKIVKKILCELVISKEYTFFDTIRYFRGAVFSMNVLLDEMRTIDLIEKIDKVAIPIYFCMGKHDLMTPFQPTERFYNTIEAPEKHWIWFENSSHTPMFEEKEKFVKLLRSEVKKDECYFG